MSAGSFVCVFLCWSVSRFAYTSHGSKRASKRRRARARRNVPDWHFSVNEKMAAAYSLPSQREPTLSNQDLGIAVKPDMHDMQRWARSRASHNLARYLAPPQPPTRSVETRYTQRACTLTDPLGTKCDATISPARYRPAWAPRDDAVSRQLRVGSAPPKLRAMGSASMPVLSLAAAGKDAPFTAPYRSSLDRAFACPQSRPCLAGSASSATHTRTSRSSQPASAFHGVAALELPHAFVPGHRTSAVRVGAGGKLLTTWRQPSRCTAGEKSAGRAWGPIVRDIYRESRRLSEW